MTTGMFISNKDIKIFAKSDKFCNQNFWEWNPRWTFTSVMEAYYSEEKKKLKKSKCHCGSSNLILIVKNDF